MLLSVHVHIFMVLRVCVLYSIILYINITCQFILECERVRESVVASADLAATASALNLPEMAAALSIIIIIQS